LRRRGEAEGGGSGVKKFSGPNIFPSCYF
jgi:hypothetical protein